MFPIMFAQPKLTAEHPVSNQTTVSGHDYKGCWTQPLLTLTGPEIAPLVNTANCNTLRYISLIDGHVIPVLFFM